MKKREKMRGHRESVRAERGLWLEGGPPLRQIPSFIIHTARYCTHIHTPCKSAHKLGQGVAASVGASTSTKGDCECPACRRLFDGFMCVCVRSETHLSLSLGLVCVCVSVGVSVGTFCTLNHKREKKKKRSSECVNDSWSQFVTQVSSRRWGQTLVKLAMHRELAPDGDAFTSTALCQDLHTGMCTNPACVGVL